MLTWTFSAQEFRLQSEEINMDKNFKEEQGTVMGFFIAKKLSKKTSFRLYLK